MEMISAKYQGGKGDRFRWWMQQTGKHGSVTTQIMASESERRMQHGWRKSIAKLRQISTKKASAKIKRGERAGNRSRDKRRWSEYP